MVQTFQKGKKVLIGTHFSTLDFDCHCARESCTETLIDKLLPTALDSLWNFSGPFKIDSGFRCKEHNREVGGVSDSQHRLGKAADCKSLIGKTGIEMAAAAEHVFEFQNGGIGIYSKFIHTDVRGHKARWDLSNWR